jgi:rubredoxin
MITGRMENLVSKGAARVEGRAPHPIEIGRRKYRRASAREATHAIATLLCPECGKEKRFLADTPVGALIAAREAGWARMPDKWTCPICVKKLRARQALLN